MEKYILSIKDQIFKSYQIIIEKVMLGKSFHCENEIDKFRKLDDYNEYDWSYYGKIRKICEEAIKIGKEIDTLIHNLKAKKKKIEYYIKRFQSFIDHHSLCNDLRTCIVSFLV